MLIIRRREGEAILIGDSIEIRVEEVAHNRVKLAILAGKEVPVVRKEVKETRDLNLTAAGGLSAVTLQALLTHIRRLSPGRPEIADIRTEPPGRDE